MTAVGRALRLREPAPALLRAQTGQQSLSEVSVRRRLGWVWGLLFLNAVPYSASPVLHLPSSLGKVITQGALVAALVVVLSVNRRVLVRPNLFLTLMTALCVTSAMMSVQGYFGFGSMLRAGRLVLFVAALWLLTPWWGRRDLLLLRFHRRALMVALGSVLVGAMIAPGAAFGQAGGGRLGGTIWPIPPTRVADYAAILAGTTIILWFTGLIRSRPAAILTLSATAILLLTHTRTALIGLLLGVLVGALSLFASRKRVRSAIGITVVISCLVALSLAPFLSAWFLRGESGSQLEGLTGRTSVWSAVMAQPRTELHILFGFGMSNDGFGGRPIDSSWFSAYVDQGLFGVVVDAAVLVVLFVIALMSPRGPRRALAMFFVVYVLVSSLTETGLGQASSYLLDLGVAMSVLMTPVTVDSDRPRLQAATTSGDAR